MSNIPFICAITLALALTSAQGQAPALNQDDLLKTLDKMTLDPSGSKPGDTSPGIPPKTKAPSITEITSNNATFNNKTHIAIFIDDVVVKNPDFNVTCDKLTAYLLHDDEPAKPGEKATPKPATPAPTPSANGTEKAGDTPPKPKKGGLEKAHAEPKAGEKVIVTQDKKEADGSITHSIGKGEHADYNAITGEITLTGWPEVKQGINSGISQEAGAVIIMTRDGKMRTTGRVKWLIQDNGSK